MSDRIDGLEGGADSYLTEPVEAEVLVASVKSLLRLYQREEENRRLVQTARERERLLQSTFEQASEAILVCDNQGRITRASHRATTLAGQYPVGKLFTEVFPLELRTSVRLRFRDTAAGSNPSLYELANVEADSPREASVVRCDGTRIHLLFSCKHLQSEKNLEQIGYTVALTDITAHKQAEAALRDSEEKFRAAFEWATVGKAQFDLETGRFNAVNDHYCQITGYSREELLQMRVYDLDHPADRDADEKALARLLRAESGQYRAEKRNIRKDGAVIWVQVEASLIRDGQGLPIRIIGIILDITERKRLEEELKRRMEELKVSDRRKDDFLATLAHELRNPLAPIRNAAAILQRMHVSDPQLQWCRDIIDQQVSQISRLLDDLLDLSRITRDRLELRKERIELTRVIQGAVDISRPLIDEFEHELTVSIPSEPIDVVADEVRLTQVLSNLLNNAAKYTEQGGKIWLRAEREGADLIISVKDTGIGIPTDQLNEVFEMFSQLQRSLEQTRQGLGVGLTLVKRLVEMHGGSIEVRSDGPGEGSEFILRLPIVIEHRLEATAAENGDEGSKISSLRILVADDHVHSNESLTKILQMMGHEILSAYDGEEAFATAEKFAPRVALLDIGMPKLNGYDLCRRIREQPWGKTMVLVALTGWGGERDRRRGLEAGFNDHLTKPVPPEELEQLIANMVKN
jgi:two-component system CheB/CheR fusion protein